MIAHAMKCPKCRKHMAEGAVAHGCGWRVVVPHTREAVGIPASREVAVAAIARVREILTGVSGKQDTVRANMKRSAREVSLLSDVGHGDCACEVCCAERARRRAERGAGV